MQTMGLYERFPPETPLIAGFKKYLLQALHVHNCQQEVDNVGRMLRYIQPSGEDVSLDFLTKITETTDYINNLRRTKMTPAILLNYIKNTIHFFHFLKLQLSLRYDRYVEGQRSLHECHKVMRHKTANMQIATFALNTEQTAMLDVYCHYIRPVFVKESGEEEDRFFTSSNGRPISCASQDLSLLHAYYKLPNVTTQEIRRVAETLAGQNCTEEQKTTVAHYLAHSNVVSEGKYRGRTLEEAVFASNLLGGFENSSEDSGGEMSSGAEKIQRNEEDGKEDLSKFLVFFPVKLDGQPPTKKKRV
ncbi:hypothetical protein ILYODFUR_029404 [Ilyodon furcidens]|uniref:Uncharacterized protein n=1 Tax=Ilyodon furcidens TaxID=33524 RepID=A0ABV0UN40_9TELE